MPMGLKDLLVYVDHTEGALVRFRLAADLASRHGSRLTALYARQWSEAQIEERRTAELGLVSPDDVDRLHRRIEASIDGAVERLRSALNTLGREHGVKAEWRCVDGPASIVVPEHARYADLCILSRDAAADGNSVDYSFSEKMLFVTGRPALFVPSVGSFETLGRHVAVAWNSSRAAARAVNDALPLIELTERTTVIAINPEAYTERPGALPAGQMVEHLRRHGAATDLVQLENVPVRSIPDALQAKAHELGADLIVAGAFGHPKLWEKLLGGVSRDLLDRMSLPVLMSH
jgi:nucleotide-binding universal stress UspA family protein